MVIRYTRAALAMAGGRLRRLWPLSLLTFSLLISVVLLGIAWMLPAPQTSSVLTGRTEGLTLLPEASAMSTLPLMKVRDLQTGKCIDEIALRPRAEAELRPGARPKMEIYRSPNDRGKTLLILSGGWMWEGQNGSSGYLQREYSLAIDPRDLTCTGGAHLRVPVSGQVMTGSELSTDDVKFLQGSLTIYARSIDHDTIYQASKIDLPPDSRIGMVALDEAGQRDVPRWSGFLSIDNVADTSGFDINLATDAAGIPIVMPASAREGGKPDRISIGLFAQIAGDPLMQWLAGFFLLLATILSVVGQIWASPARP